MARGGKGERFTKGEKKWACTVIGSSRALCGKGGKKKLSAIRQEQGGNGKERDRRPLGIEVREGDFDAPRRREKGSARNFLNRGGGKRAPLALGVPSIASPDW